MQILSMTEQHGQTRRLLAMSLVLGGILGLPSTVAWAAPPIWTALPGTGKDIGAGGGALWVVSTSTAANGFSVFRWVNSAWFEVPGAGAVRLAVDPQGNAWIVDDKGAVQRHDGSKWVAVAGIHASDIGVGADGSVWAVGSQPFDAGGFGIYRYTGTSWTQMPGAAVRIDVDPKGNAWIVNKLGEVFRWGGSAWVAVLGVKARDVGIGADGSVFVLGVDDKVYRWGGSAWVAREGSARNITVNAAGVPYAVTDAGVIYQGVK